MAVTKDGISTERIENSEHMASIPIDLDDPHRGALEDNPERAEKLSWRLVLAVMV
jgi:hypothetical protein